MKPDTLNAERLLALYERVADAPDAIARLRRFVLDLAVRGKLVEQDPNDEPASELLERIAAERERSSRAKKRKSSALEAETFEGDLFSLPQGWSWTPLASISDVTMGQSPPGDTYNKSGEGVPLINGPVEFTTGPFGHTVVNQFTTAPINFCEEGDLLICVRGSTTGRTNVAAFRACIGRGVAAIRSSFDDGFIRLFLWKSREDIISMGRGIAFPSVSKKQLENLAIPLPPLAEQRRIVAKVEELMALLDRLEAARTTAEANRERLTAVSLARLTAPDTTPDAFPAHARFALDALPALTTRPGQIKALRQTILNLAVRGKLVEQDPNDEPASELLKRISDARERAIAEGRIKKSRKPSVSASKDIDIQLPEGWAMTCLSDVYDVRDGTHDTPKYVDDGIPLVTSKNLSTGVLSLENTKLISLSDYRMISERSKVDREDILFAMIGSIGNPVIVDTEAEFSIKNVALFKYYDRTLSCPSYLRYFLLHAANEMRQRAVGGLQPFVSLGFLRSFPLLLPPLAEQRRIVGKVDALMVLCDRLEDALTTADTTKQRLLESLLHEALTPTATARELEAAAV